MAPKLPRPRNRREPVASLDDHGAGVWDWLSSWIPSIGHKGLKNVTEGTLYGVPAAWRCAMFIANAVASAGPPIVNQAGGEGDHVTMRPTPAVAASPWPMVTPHDFWSSLTLSLLLYGNFLAAPRDFDPVTGYPRQAVPLHPGEVTFRIEDGRPRYTYRDFEWEYGEVLHIRGHLPPGKLWGVGVIGAHRIGLSESVDHQEYGMNIYGGSAVPPWVVGVDDPTVSEEEAERIAQRMGAVRANGDKLPAVIPSNMSISTLAFSPADAQFLEAKRWNATEVAWMFGMDPADLGVAMPGASLTYANIGERSVERLTHTVGPWLRRIEQGWTHFMLPGDQQLEFPVDSLLRTDPETLMSNLSTGYEAGLYTYNECRHRLRLPKISEAWADEPFGKPESAKAPPPLPAPVDSPQEDDDDDDDA